MAEHIFYFRIELMADGKDAAEAWERAVESFTQDPGDPPPMESELTDTPVFGTCCTIDAGEPEE